jgi:hypothetical protein
MNNLIDQDMDHGNAVNFASFLYQKNFGAEQIFHALMRARFFWPVIETLRLSCLM